MALAASAMGGTSVASKRVFIVMDNSLAIAYQLTNLKYVEPSDTCALSVCTNANSAGYFDRESGYINGVRVDLSRLGFDGRVYGRVNYSLAGGYVQYQGYTQGGTPIPSGVSGAIISDYSARLGPAFSSGPVLAVPFVQYGHHAWRRFIGVDTPQAYEEDYSHNYLAVGGLFQLAMTPVLVGSVYALAGQTFSPAISVPGLGFEQNLGSSALVKAGARLDFRVSYWFGLYAGIRYTRFSYGQSRPQQVGNLIIMEPQSNTVIASYEGGMRVFF